MGDGAQAFYVLCATLPGVPLIYSGQEMGLNRACASSIRTPLASVIIRHYESFFRSLNNLKKDNQAIWNGDNGGTLYTVHVDNAVWVYARRKGMIRYWSLSTSHQTYTT